MVNTTYEKHMSIVQGEKMWHQELQNSFKKKKSIELKMIPLEEEIQTVFWYCTRV